MEGKRKKSDVTRILDEVKRLGAPQETEQPATARERRQIFWPSHCTKRGGGLLVGWNVHSFTACVATVTHRDVDLDLLENALHIIAHSERYSHLFNDNGGPPTVLGEYREQKTPGDESQAIKTIRQAANFWLTLDNHLGQPRLCDIHCCGFRYSVFSVTVQFVLFNQPRASCYYSTLPFGSSPHGASPAFDQVSEFERALMQINDSYLVESVLDEVIQRLRCGSHPSILLRSWSKEELDGSNGKRKSAFLSLRESQRGAPDGGSQRGEAEGLPAPSGDGGCWRRGGVAEAGVAPVFSMVGSWRLLVSPVGKCIRHVLLQVLLFLLLGIRLCASPLYWALNVPLIRKPSPVESQVPPQWLHARELSATARQLQHRMSSLFSSPLMSPAALATLHRKPSNARAVSVAMHLTTSAALFAVDLIAGVVCCCLMVTHVDEVLEAVDHVAAHQSMLLLQAIRWIMGVPAGLKLNDNLDYCLGNLCILGVKCFQVVYLLLQPYLPWAVRTVALSGIAGFTLLISLVSDLLSLLTLHISIFYTISARWHGVQTRVLGSLWRLFRGRKRNVLRGRIDACDYSLDQLLLGTLLFTLLVFLFPTTFIYYLLFCIPYLFVGIVQAVIRMTVSLMNHFPISTLVLRILQPSHVPGGVFLKLLPPAAESDTAHSLDGPTAAQLTGGGRGMRASTSLPDMGHLTLPRRSSNDGPVGLEAAWAASMKPSPLRANERRKSSLVGRSSHFELSNRPLPMGAIFRTHTQNVAAVLKQYDPGKVLRSLLLSESMPQSTLPDRPSCQLLPVVDFWIFAKGVLMGSAERFP